MFENILGLLALLSLIPFILLYLRRPKPESKTIPSLMFLIKDKKNSKRYSLFRKIVNNLLFLLQLITLILLSLSVASPFIKMPYDVTLENTVIVLDSSASMQAKEKGVTRFDKALKEARNSLSGENSIILAQNIPLIVLEEESTDAAIEILSKLKPKSTTTNLEDAMLLGKDILGDKAGRVVVISDFSSVSSSDLLVVKKTLVSEDLVVDFIDVSNKVDNIGITKLEVRKHSMKVYVKNFKNKEQAATLKLMQNDKELSHSGEIKILPKSVESFIFDDTPAGVSQIVLSPKDNFEVDNTIYISTPVKKHIDTLLITNEVNSNLEIALESSKDINLNVIDLYKSPAMNFNTKGENIKPYDHEIIIVHKMNKPGDRGGMLLSGLTDIVNYIKKGGKVVFTAQENLESIKLNNILDQVDLVKTKGLSKEASNVCVDIINQFTKQFEQDICFTITGKYFYSDLEKESISIASTPNKNPIIALTNFEKGKVSYYGIFDDNSEFKTLPSYPIFWNGLINFMVDTESINEYNYPAGKILTLTEQKVKTPSGSLRTSKLIMDEAGIYELNNNKKLAVNLLDEKESDLESSLVEDEESKKQKTLEKGTKQHNFPITSIVLLIAFGILAFETIYIKRRGDL